MSLDHTEMQCPACHFSDVNMTGEPVISHKPNEHGWYGQVHTVTIPFECKCGQKFAHEVVAYKCRATARTEVPT
jgi:hypothetical protein